MPRRAPPSPAPKSAAAPAARPARRWSLVLMALCLVGLGAAVYLAVLHWQVHNQPGHVSFCALSEHVNCDTAAMSSYSRVAGVPVATWGILFYGLLLVLLGWGLLARRPPWPWGILSALNAASVGVSAFLGLVSHAIIQS
ncbi:MAG TPA: vitamin K epoxide reductase family protein, partial [Myxococcota bacterium]|nr:vitamin K epoxide reductase family protein [Myxococcota bacterium]